jgi:hypothetical protein
MKLVSAPESILRDLIWNAELMAIGMRHDAVEKQSATLRSYISEEAFWPNGMPDAESKETVVNLFTHKRLPKS